MTSFDVAALIAEKCEAFITPVRLAGAERAFLSRIAAAYVGGARLLVRGPNIMLGYCRAKNPGVIEALSGGLYDTGDTVAIDRQGFVAIRDAPSASPRSPGKACRFGLNRGDHRRLVARAYRGGDRRARSQSGANA
jgi:acyl-CoA synthetase (AMP-forming)/AMP-acid ligase II